jgi:5-(carboxyamino)imidazole ribonucleotide synthase
MILPPAMLGMLGGGQLGRFFVIAAHEMGYRVAVLDPDADSPAGKIAELHLCAEYGDRSALDKLAASCAAISTEFENVPAETLHYLARSLPVHPAASAVAVCQHRVQEKDFLRDNGLPHAPYAGIATESDFDKVSSEMYPAILKVARFGYDGKGQARVADRRQAQAAFAAFKGEPCVLEKQMQLDAEVSVVLARDSQGNIQAFNPAENIHRNGILDISIVPARVTADILEQARTLARKVAEKLNYIGVLGVEFFVCSGSLYVNEMAPRPHNSGHYTLDACITNQFEQQVRAMCGLPLGDARQHSPAVMVNLLGDVWRAGEPHWSVLLQKKSLKLHLYGKQQARAGRKMGHFTVLAQGMDDAYQEAMQARLQIKVEG